MRAKRYFQVSLSAVALTGLLLASACGKADDLPSDVSSSLSSGLSSSLSPSTDKSDDEIKAAIPKILKGLEDIKQEIKGLQLTGISPAAPSGKPASGSKPTVSTTAKPSTGSKPSGSAATSSTKPATPAAPTSPAAPSAQAEFQTILQTLSAKPFVQATVEKTEKSFADAHVSQVKLNMYTKTPSLVKIEILSSTSGAAGAKIVYNSGDNNKAKIRPGGSLSFITTELPKTDDRVLSTNDYQFDDIDLFGVVKRWSTGYTAELVGKTQLDGAELYILKVKAKGTNGLDERIDYEYIGYEPDSHKLRLWEMYTPGVKDPFFRLSLLKLEYPASLADSIFKL